jgi:DNA-binding response OmpR family regulator
MDAKTRVIAIIADEFTANRPLAEKLREAGFRVEVVVREQVTCDRLAALSPDIIITDFDEDNAQNPFHVITKIREDERLKNAEIFFYSASIDVKTEITLRKLKIVSYFIKSDNIGYMVDAVQTHFHNIETAGDSRFGEEMQARENGETQTGPDDDAPGVGADELGYANEFKNMFSDLTDNVEEDHKTGGSPFEAIYNLGVSYYDKELYDKAIEEFGKAAQSPDWRLRSLLMTGMTQRKMGELEKAVVTFKTGYRDAGGEFDKMGFLYELGETLDAMGKMEEAYKMFAAVYQRDKTFRDAKAKLISLKSAIEIKNKI